MSWPSACSSGSSSRRPCWARSSGGRHPVRSAEGGAQVGQQLTPTHPLTHPHTHLSKCSHSKAGSGGWTLRLGSGRPRAQRQAHPTQGTPTHQNPGSRPGPTSSTATPFSPAHNSLCRRHPKSPNAQRQAQPNPAYQTWTHQEFGVQAGAGVHDHRAAARGAGGRGHGDGAVHHHKQLVAHVALGQDGDLRQGGWGGRGWDDRARWGGGGREGDGSPARPSFMEQPSTQHGQLVPAEAPCMCKLRHRGPHPRWA